MNLGLVGPRILDLGPDSHDATLAKLHDNPDTWLSFTDLVMIDPIGTGWSRAVKPDDAKHFWNVAGDAGAMAKAIALYVAHNNRAAHYLIGTPLLADFLEEALDEFGESCADYED